VNRNGLIETIAANQPRFDYDPVTGECKGLLIEESRTNLMTGSDDFGPTYWVPLNSVSVSTNVITAPDGTLTADKFGENTLGVLSHKVIARSFTLSASTTYTFSVFVKSAERTNIMIHLRKSDYNTRFGGFFNLSTKTFTSENAAGGTLVSSSITQFPNNWYRISVTGDIGTNTAAVTTLYLCNTSNSISYAGDGTSGIYVWGAQLEQGAFPTSYIPTTASTVTRSADNASMTGTNFSSWYNQTGYSVFTSHIAPIPQTIYFPRIFNIGKDASDINRLNFYHTPSTVGYRVGMSVIENNSITNVDFATTTSQGTKLKLAGAFAENNSYLYVNGSIIGTDIKCSINSVTRNILNIGSTNNNQAYLNSTIAKFTYYPKALSPAELQYLTT
jgi:hypothetical protein